MRGVASTAKKVAGRNAKKILSQASDYGIKGAFTGLKAGANYIVVSSDELVEHVLDRAEEYAQKKARRGIKKIK